MTQFTITRGGLPVNRRVTAVIGGVILLQLFLVSIYLLYSPVTITDPLILIYPIVWITVGIWAILTTTPVPSSQRNKTVALLVGMGYFLILTTVSGLLSLGSTFHSQDPSTTFRLVLTSVPPGWAPAVFYNGSIVTIVILPFMIVGYIALSYLVYVTILDASGSAMAGFIGLFSCVSCTWPILGTILASVFGGSSAVVAFALNQSYGVSTIVFVSAIALLYWRPLR